MSGIIKFAANRVWRTYQGGKLLDEMQKKACPADSSFPEDWIGSMVQATNAGREALSEGLSMITSESGELTPFKSLVLSEPDFYLGQDCEVEDVPLVKYLDSATRLHFQVHPSREFAKQRLGSSRGKTEAYVILAIRDDIQQPYIYAGFQRPPSRKQLKSWIEQQNIDEIEGCFDKIPVKPGDVFLIPGGRPHALGEGILMLEIMEPSDLAVRFEFERCGYVIPEAARFMNRDIETALDVFDFSPVTGESIDSTFRCSPELILDENGGNRLESLIDSHHTPCFRVRRATTKGIFSRRETSCFYGIVAEGCGMIKTENQSLMLNQWDRFFCPAGVEAFSYHSGQNMTVLECYPGGL